MAHPLDDLVWNALSTRQRRWAVGDARALRLHPEIGIFAGTAGDDREGLAALVAPGAEIALLGPTTPPTPRGLVRLGGRACLQMVMEGAAPVIAAPGAGTLLAAADAPDMLALARLTEPGPFFARTPEFGRFLGIRSGGRLVAMAGTRLRTEGFTEISGVCTHPEARGQGFAQRLMLQLAAGIGAEGERAFLHVYPENARAIRLYEALGFRIRTALMLDRFGRA